MRPTPTLISVLGMLLLGFLITLSSCTKPDETKQPSSRNEPAQTGQSTPSKPDALATPTTSGSPTTASVPAASAIASADGERAGTRVEITELKRSSDNTVTLKFVMVNDTADKIGFGYDYGDKDNYIKDHGSVGGVTLVDSKGKKKYFVVRDTENSCLCSKDLADIPAKGRANLWAKFPAPPDDVQKISIVIPHFGPMDDVPISR